MAFNEEVEELEFNSVFQDDEDEEYEDVSEFRDYSEEEVSSKWGNFTFEDLVFELDNILGASKKYFFSKKKRVVDAEEMANLTKLVAEKLPGEIVEARSIIANRENLIAGARRDADAIKADADAYHQRTIENAKAQAANIIADAEAKARQMVSEHEITRQAKDEGARIVAEAKAEARSIVERTSAECDKHIERVMSWADENITGVNGYVFGLLGSAREMLIGDIQKIDGMKAKYEEDLTQKFASLKAAPRITKKN